MAFIHPTAREVHFKIVYAGPSRGGKTTNLLRLHERLPADKRGPMLSLAGPDERTLFFDFMALDLGTVGGLAVKLQLYTVPGQVQYNATRRVVLAGADAVVFVADSQEERMEANIESIRNLEENLQEHGFELSSMPYALQFNKRDLPTAVPVDNMYRILNFKGEPTFEGIAVQGMGVFETLKAVAKLVLQELSRR